MASYRVPPTSPSKRRKEGNIRYITGNDEVFGELLQGGVEAWTVERTMCDDGFTFDFGISLEDGNFGKENQIICWTKRRTSKANNTPALNASNGYGRMVLVRGVTESTKKTRSTFADKLVQVSVRLVLQTFIADVSCLLTNRPPGTQRHSQRPWLEGATFC